MVNKTLFASQAKTNKALNNITRNEAGGRAIRLENRQALAQLASTGTLNKTFYQTANQQLDKVLELTNDVGNEFIAKTAVYARQHNHMKDMPVLLLAVLSQQDQDLFKQVFPLVIDNGKQLRNFVQIMRSGVVLRQSLGSLPKRMVNDWLLNASDNQLLSASIGNAPSLADVLKMTHPKPANAAQEAFFAYVLGKTYQLDALPQKVQALEKFRQGLSSDVPDVPMQLLTSLSLNAEQWANIAKNGSWQMLRMNLNTFLRHGVFDIAGMAEVVAAKLVDEQAIAKSRVLPYQLMMTWSALQHGMPLLICEAVADAMQLALKNVPTLEGSVVIAIDVSGSMASPVTGYREGSTSQVTCMQVAALFASALKQVNPNTRLMPFDTEVRTLALIDQVKSLFGYKQPKLLELARQLTDMCGGGTSCGKPLKKLNQEKTEVDLVIYLSDNQSWADQAPQGHCYLTTSMMHQWAILKQRCPQAKLVCVDLQAYSTTQMPERVDVMNIGGFSDDVFRLIDVFAKGDMHADHWVHEVEAIQLKTYS